MPWPAPVEVEVPGGLADLRGPADATVRTPVTLHVTAFGGRNSCESFGRILLSIDHASRAVAVRSTVLQPDGGGSCLAVIQPLVVATVSFVPEATGTYLVTGFGLPSGPGETDATPTSTLSLTVVTATD